MIKRLSNFFKGNISLLKKRDRRAIFLTAVKKCQRQKEMSFISFVAWLMEHIPNLNAERERWLSKEFNQLCFI
jgi:hypothetical protein